MDKDTESAKDVPVSDTSVTSAPSTPTTSAATDVSARRSCPRCGRRMSSLQFDKHTLCVVCRDMKCSLDTRCKECKAWSKEFMLGYVKHQRSGFESKEDYTVFFSFAASNSGNYRSSSFPPISNFF